MHEYTRGNYLISTDPNRLDLDAIFAFISRSYWGANRTREVMQRALQNSLNFGIYDEGEGGRQIGLVRVVSDYAVFVYLCDVYILEEYRGQGLGKWLLEVVRAYPQLQGLRRWVLVTRDAHGFYRRYGFTELVTPERWMEAFDPNPKA